MTDSEKQTGTRRSNGFLSLAAAIVVCALVWLVVLPHLSERPQMKAHLDWLDHRGIDPAAMYYTELEVMEKILARQRNRHLSRRRSRLVNSIP